MSIALDPRRYFTDQQKLQIFTRAEGKCERCTVQLDEVEWEAHHKIPHSEGGQTHVDNGEALCVPCHGFRHRELNDKPASYFNFRKDYSWQERAIETYLDAISTYYNPNPGQAPQAYVVEVSPSGGKTIFSMKLAKQLINLDLVDRVVWVVPRDSIKMGFVDDCKRAGKIEESKRLRLGGEYLSIEASLTP